MRRWWKVTVALALLCAVIGSVMLLAQAQPAGPAIGPVATNPDFTPAQPAAPAPSPLMLWIATAIGGVGGVFVVQALKKLIDKALPEPIGKKAMFYVAWAVSFGCGIAAYAIFPEGRAAIAKNPLAIFQAGSTVSALAAAIYKLIAERVKFSRSLVAKSATPPPPSPAAPTT